MITEILAARAAAFALMIGKAFTIALLLVAIAISGLAVVGHNGNGNGKNQTATAPEIDPGSAVAALVLMSCGTLILTDRRRKS